MKFMAFLKVFFLSFFLFIIFGCFQQNFAHASSTLFFSTPPKVIEEGDRVSVNVRVNSTDQSINAISGIFAFPADLLQTVSIVKDNSIINLWTKEPKAYRDKIVFEGIVLNPGFQGAGGNVFRVTFEAKKTGQVNLGFNEGSVLANDGLGSNVLVTFGKADFKIINKPVIFQDKVIVQQTEGTTSLDKRLVALPVITEYSPLVNSLDTFFVKGKGEPDALTKIVFKDVSVKSVGERLIAYLQSEKKKLDEVLVKNNNEGLFEYISPKDLVAGVYNATPFLVDTDANVEKPGLGVQLLVSDSKIVKTLVVVINVLGLLIPIVTLIVIIYFIPWYSWRRMRLLKKRMGLEEEKIDLSGHQMERQEKILDKTVDKLVEDKSKPGQF